VAQRLLPDGALVLSEQVEHVDRLALAPAPNAHAIRVRTFPIIYSTRLMNSATPCISQVMLRKRTHDALDLPQGALGRPHG
jgi:hypothetical protein